ncbi:hypothetical protein HY442_01200 [Candidatus Parcubacteria bacterium]|nr:hypothetical protein [Candidatus Parcubacteria bacterium]MBI4099128.1 hypothetical protein [Candidatus Parcubacteria bacterium]MBI4385369.1 hypothetical protein [Candidatus Parcubacteria bacterium]
MRKFTDRKQFAFSIVEGLAVLAIVAVVATLVLANLRLGQRKTLLENEALRLSQVVSRARTNALGSVTFQGAVPTGGYGVRFDLAEADNVAVLFADANGNQRFGGDFGACSGECVERVVFTSGVVVASLSPESPLDITFVPPDGAATIRAGTSALDRSEGRVALSFPNDPNMRKTIVITQGGQIRVE